MVIKSSVRVEWYQGLRIAEEIQTIREGVTWLPCTCFAYLDLFASSVRYNWFSILIITDEKSISVISTTNKMQLNLFY